MVFRLQKYEKVCTIAQTFSYFGFLWRRSVLKEVCEGGDYAHFFDVGGVLIAVFDGELSLIGGLYLAELGVGVFGEFVGSLTGVLCGLGYHLGFDGVEFGVVVGDGIGIVVGDGYATFHQLALAVDEFMDFVDLRGADGDH